MEKKTKKNKVKKGNHFEDCNHLLEIIMSF